MKAMFEQKDIEFRTSDCNGAVPKLRLANGKNSIDALNVRSDKDFANRTDHQYEDTLDLTKELKQAAEQCQFLATKLNRRKEAATTRSSNLTKEPTTTEKDCQEDLRRKIQALVDENVQLRHRSKIELIKDMAKQEIEDNTDLKLKLQATVEENIRLRQILKDVTEVNKRWQKYNQDRQDYVQRLLSTIQELEEKANNQALPNICNPEDSITKQQIFQARHSDSDLLDASGTLPLLRKSHDICVKENIRLQKEVEEMRKNFEELTHQLQATRNENKEQEEMLKLQVRMFEEDFLAEQKEKVIAKAKINELADELNSLRAKYEAEKNISPQCRTTVAERSDGSTSANYAKSFQNLMLPLKNTPNFVQKHFIGNLVNTGLMTDTACKKKSYSETGPHGSWEALDLHSSGEDNTVHCPGCTMAFPSNRHYEFLDHFRECQKTNSY